MTHLARTPKQLGAIVRRLRKMQQLTQTELGSRTHLRQATISALESGEAGTQIKTLTDVLTALNLEIIIQERSKAPSEIVDIFS
jgi:HTH-type transcriptional regulator / antitoxin HipB